MNYRFGHFELDASARELRAAGAIVETEPKAFDLLAYLAAHRDRAVSKDELLEALWPRQIVTETALTRAVMKARRAVGDDSERQAVIRTVHGHGYRFVAEMSTETLPGDDEAVGEPVVAPTAWWRRSTAAIVVLALSLVAAAALVLTREDAPVQEGGSLAVLPVTNRVEDPELGWVRLGLMSLMQRMLEEGGVDVVADRAVLDSLGDASLATPPDIALFEQVRSRSGATSVFYTTLDRQGGLHRLSAILVHPDGRKSRRVIVGESPAALAADMANVISRLLTGSDFRVGGRFARISTDPFVNEMYARALDLELQGKLEEARQLFRLASEQEPELFWLRYEIALCTRDLREWELAEEMFAALRDEAAAGTDRRALVVTSNSMGIMYFNRNQYDQAEALFRQALAAAEGGEFADERASVQINLGLIASRRGQLDVAAKHYDLALEVYRGAGQEPAPALLNNYAGLLMRTGDLERARQLSEQAVEGFRVLGNRRFEAPALNRLARILRRQGDLAAAIERHEQAMAIYRELGNEVGELSAKSALTSVYLARGDLSRASINARDVLERAQGTADEILVGDALVQHAEVEMAFGRPRNGLRDYESALDIFSRLGDNAGLRAAESGIAEAALDLGDFERAGTIAARLLDEALSAGQGASVARARLLSGRVAEQRGDRAAAADLYRAALDYARAEQDGVVLPMSAMRLAGLELDQGSVVEAVALLDEARPWVAENHDFLRLEAQLALAQADKPRARELLLRLREMAGEAWTAADGDLLAAAKD